MSKGGRLTWYGNMKSIFPMGNSSYLSLPFVESTTPISCVIFTNLHRHTMWLSISFYRFIFWGFSILNFYARQMYRQVLLRASISYGNSVCSSVCLSVTTRYRFKAKWDRDSGFSPYDSLEYLVSYEVIWCRQVRRFPSNEGIKEIVILSLLARLAWKRLQIDTDLLPIITSTADELSSGTNIDDLERPWTPKIGV